MSPVSVLPNMPRRIRMTSGGASYARGWDPLGDWPVSA
ncbi:hypothetical protein C731_1428 [Mycolicibacterium hassiacum DSM 44199]|uniref:Uncharacterized protein n=1 Tax=Mycolicibacterium hassiacum (strain DSM 44199 / CIP 105218 / JCM 12690 / 3849) TaxID=1122247 RepID=K5B8Y2_MYCHD|nr:hypothetical protein C731_1428 [Mycolicibacterium hassiacum DSM 44199]